MVALTPVFSAFLKITVLSLVLELRLAEGVHDYSRSRHRLRGQLRTFDLCGVNLHVLRQYVCYVRLNKVKLHAKDYI